MRGASRNCEGLLRVAKGCKTVRGTERDSERDSERDNSRDCESDCDEDCWRE